MPVNNISLTSPYAAEQQDIERRRKIYEALQAQAIEPTTTQTVGGWAIPNSPWQGVGKIAQALAGAYGQKTLGEQQKALGERKNQAVTDALNSMPQGTPAQPESYSGAPEDEMYNPAVAAKQPTMQDNTAWLGRLAQIDPSATAIGSTMLGMQQKQNENRETREARIAAALESEKQATRLQGNLLADRQAGRDQSLADRQAGRDQNEGMRRDLATDADRRAREMQTSQQQYAREAQRDRAAMRPAPAVQPLVQIMGPNNQPMWVERKDAVGQKPAGTGGRGTAMSSTAQKELIQTDEEIQGGQAGITAIQQAQKINKDAMGFIGAGALSAAGTLLPESVRPKTFDATENLDNILKTGVLPQLKATFGGNPTEGERKILVEIQGSSNKSPAVRKAIFERAITAAERRISFSQQKAKSLRDGTYFAGDGGIDPAAPPAETPATPDRRNTPDRRGATDGWSVVR